MFWTVMVTGKRPEVLTKLLPRYCASAVTRPYMEDKNICIDQRSLLTHGEGSGIRVV